MDLTYPAEAEEFRVEIRAWLEDNLPDGWFDDGFEMTTRSVDAFNAEWPQKLFEGGWICATWPKEYGGKGLTTMQGVVLAEEFARAKAPMRGDFFGDTLVGPTLLQWGTEEQKQEFLPGILKGTTRWCQGFSEPNSGSDLASLKTTAVLDGDEWVINGQKVWTTQGHHADYCFLLTRTDPTRPSTCRHLVHARADEASPASRCAASPSPTAPPSSARCSSPTPAAEGQRRRRRQQRLEGRQLHAGVRARPVGHHRLPPLRGGVPTHARGGARTNGADRRPDDPPAVDGVLHQDPDPADQRPAQPDGGAHGVKDMGTVALGATNKMFWSEMHKAAMELALDIWAPRRHAPIDGTSRPRVGVRGPGRQLATSAATATRSAR
jgi:hypothetical protein